MAEHENYKPLDANDPKAIMDAFTKQSPEIPRDESVPSQIARLILVGELLIECIEGFGEGPQLTKAKSLIEKALLQTLTHYANVER